MDLTRITTIFLEKVLITKSIVSGRSLTALLSPSSAEPQTISSNIFVSSQIVATGGSLGNPHGKVSLWRWIGGGLNWPLLSGQCPLDTDGLKAAQLKIRSLSQGKTLPGEKCPLGIRQQPTLMKMLLLEIRALQTMPGITWSRAHCPPGNRQQPRMHLARFSCPNILHSGHLATRLPASLGPIRWASIWRESRSNASNEDTA